MADLTDTLSGWDSLENTTAANGYIPPSANDISYSSISGGGSSSEIPTFLSAGSSILGGIGSYMQGQEESGADEYNASLSLIEGKFNVDNIDMQESEILSTQKAMYARAGVEQSGSVLDTALNTATNYEYDKQVATFNAQSQANVDEYNAKMAKSKGEMGLAEGLIKGAATLLPLAMAA